MSLAPFHLAIPVTDLAAARAFYGGLLGCREGRSTQAWIDFDFFGHQLVVHLSQATAAAQAGMVDGHGVPVPHFGVVLSLKHWDALVERLRAANVAFALEPQVRFKGKPGEQATFFFRDPSGNALEIKAFRNLGQLFAT